MDSQPSDNVTTVVIEMEPGWIYVKVAAPKPHLDRIEFFLRRTVDRSNRHQLEPSNLGLPRQLVTLVAGHLLSC